MWFDDFDEFMFFCDLYFDAVNNRRETFEYRGQMYSTACAKAICEEVVK